MGVDVVLNPIGAVDDVAVPSVRVLEISAEDVLEYKPEELEDGNIPEDPVPVGMAVMPEVVTVWVI